MRMPLGEAVTRIIFRPNSNDLTSVAKKLRSSTGISLKDSEVMLNQLKPGEILYVTDTNVIHSFPDK